MSSPPAVALETTAQAILCHADVAYDEIWPEIHARTLYFCLYPKHDYAFGFQDRVRQFLQPAFQEGHRHCSTNDKTNWTDLAAQVIGHPIWSSLLHSSCSTGLLREKWTEPNDQRDRLTQIEPCRALAMLSQATAGNSSMPRSLSWKNLWKKMQGLFCSYHLKEKPFTEQWDMGKGSWLIWWYEKWLMHTPACVSLRKVLQRVMWDTTSEKMCLVSVFCRANLMFSL